MSQRVGEVMRTGVELAHLHESLEVARQRIAAGKLDALPVVDGDRLVGIITATDFDQGGEAGGRQVSVRDVYTPSVLACRAEDELAEAAALMVKGGVHHLPVLGEGAQLVGMLARADLPQELADGDKARGGEAAEAAEGVNAGDEHPGLRVYAPRPRLTRKASERATKRLPKDD